MEQNKREKLITNIVSGVVYCSLAGKTYLIHESSSIDKIIAEQVYEDKLKEAELRGVNSNEKMVSELASIGHWTVNEQAELDTIPKRLENLKVQLYQSYFKYKGRDPIRKQLERMKKQYVKLLNKRDSLKKESAEGIGTLFKNKHLICSNVTDEHLNPLWKSGEYLKQDAKLIDILVQKYMVNRVDDDDLRELSRTEPWRTLWSVAKAEGSLFGIPAIMLTAEQKNLVMWSRIYDNVFESPDCPPDEVIEEDDMLDGWLITQSRKRDDERKSAHSFGGDKKGPAGQEVFLFADSEEDAERIKNMNDPQGQMIMKQKMASLQKAGGRLDETKMPDSQLAMRQQAMQQMKEHMQRVKN